MWMESYEEFCLRSVATLQEDGAFKTSATCEPMVTYSSVIVDCGKAALSPLLNAEQRQQMCDLRRRAAQLEIDRQKRQRSESSAQVGGKNVHCALQSQGAADSAPVPVEKETANRNKAACKKHLSPSGEAEKSPSAIATALNGYTLITDFRLQASNQPTSLNGLMAADEVTLETEDKSDEEDMSMDSLLKQTKEDVKRAPSEDASKVVIPTPSPEAISGKETFSPKSAVEFGFSLQRCPAGPPKISFHQNRYDPKRQHPGSQSPPNQLIRQPSPESSWSPRVHRRKPRPFSTGNIHIVFPGMPGEGARLSERGEALSGATWCPISSNGVGALNWPAGHQSVSPMRETCSPASPIGSATFRRRCQTMDSQLQTGSQHIDRSQERTPRFMAGVTMRPSSWRNSAAPKSFNPSAHLPHICPEVKLRKEPDDPQGSCEKASPTSLRHAGDASSAEETQRRAQLLEDLQRRLEGEHARQMSLLLAEQEKEQRCLRLELEETERRLRERENVQLQMSASCQWNRAAVQEGLAAVSPSAPKPGHSQAFPSCPVSSNVSSAQSAVYPRGPTWAAHKPQARPSQVLKAEQQRALCRIGAVARGFLVRRLLKTHKVQHLRQTVMDTREFISSFQSEGPQKRRSTLSAQDLSLHERVGAQLRAALYDIHEIFLEMPPRDRLALLQQDRELCADKKQRDAEKAKKEKERALLSAATQRSLDRKKREAESPGQAGKVMHKSKSPTPIRVAKSGQVQKCVPSQLNRQGSWYKKAPEARAKRTDNLKDLKKQHSLG